MLLVNEWCTYSRYILIHVYFVSQINLNFDRSQYELHLHIQCPTKTGWHKNVVFEEK